MKLPQHKRDCVSREEITCKWQNHSFLSNKYASLPSIISKITVNRNELWKTARLTRFQKFTIDFFTDMTATLNYLDLRSIMGCPGGMNMIQYTHSVFTCAFRANFSFKFS